VAVALPLFPLHTVLLPGANLPLHIFEPRYRQLTVDLVTETVPDRRFGIITLRPGTDIEVTGMDQVRPIGCAAVLREAKRLPDGQFDIVVTGEQRFRLLELDVSAAPYLVGAVEWVPDVSHPHPAPAPVAQLISSARAAHRRYCGAAWQRDDWTEPAVDTAPAELAHLLAADCLLAIEDRQLVLEEIRPLHRLRLVSQLLNREAGILAALHAVPAPPPGFHTPTCLN